MYNDEVLMSECIRLASSSVTNGESPFGSLISKDGQIITASENRVKRDTDVTAHAEIVAMRIAQQRIKSDDFSGYTIYTICEPCPMCAFMIRELKFHRVVFALPSPHMGGLSKWNILEDSVLSQFRPFFSAPPEICGKILQEQAKEVFEKAGFGKILL